MSTNSYIGIVNSDGSVDYSYCHWDGYPAGVGKTLVDNYTTEEQVRELLSYGSISVLGSSIGEKHNFNSNESGQQCTFYHRDRDDDLELSSVYGVPTLLRRGMEYTYLFRDGEWVSYAGGGM
jgi:hypothetical protein